VLPALLLLAACQETSSPPEDSPQPEVERPLAALGSGWRGEEEVPLGGEDAGDNLTLQAGETLDFFLRLPGGGRPGSRFRFGLANHPGERGSAGARDSAGVEVETQGFRGEMSPKSVEGGELEIDLARFDGASCVSLWSTAVTRH
jgi:hypothetical protein